MAPKKDGQENRRVVDAGRTVKQTVDTNFYLRFKERVYDGSPRWWSKEWLKHGHGVVVKKHGGSPEHGDNVLDRERDVNAAIARAHDPSVLFRPGIEYLLACVNPFCEMRTWLLVDFFSGERSFFYDTYYTEQEIPFNPHQRNSLWELIQNEHGKMARGTWSDFMDWPNCEEKKPKPFDQCPICKNNKPVFGVVDITDKWIYILTGSGGILTPDTEIYIETPKSGEIHRQFDGKRFTDRTEPFNGEFILDQHRILKETWSFFLSPVRLGQTALAMLSESPGKSTDYLKKLDSAHPLSYQVGYEPTLQPWAPVVTRVFTDAQVVPGPTEQGDDRVYPHEFIPLVDPFAWVAEILELDYLPVLAARQILMQDPRENAKAFIAATLAPEKGEDHGKSAPEKSDPWNLDSKTAALAKTWIARHKDAVKYLDDETNCACSRVFYPVKFSPVYRIVEQACQDGPDDPKCLAFGLAHWAHILREMMLCHSGIEFVKWLWKDDDAKDRIPRRNVLHGEGIKSGPPDLRAGKSVLAAQILAQFGPSIIREKGADRSEAALKGFLGEIDVEVEVDWTKIVMTPDTVKAIPDLAFEKAIKGINQEIEHYFKSIPAATEPAQFHKYLGAASARERIIAFTDGKNLLRGFAVLAGLLKWASESKKERYSGWDRYGHVVESIDTWATAADYVVSCGKYSIEEKALSELEKKIGEHAKFHKLGPYAQYKFEASSGLKTLEYLDTAGHILAGPVSLFLGGSEILLQSHEAEEALGRGDFNAAAGARLKSVAGAFVVEGAVADMFVWAGVEAAGAVITPIGWIAAGFWVLGELLGAFGAKSDYELFADHCFLGSHPGLGGEGGEVNTKFPWLGVLGWADLKDPLHGQRALLRLLSGFSVWIGFQKRTGPWWQIKSFYIPAGAYFEVEIDFTLTYGGPAEVTRRGLIFPDGDGRLVMTDNAGEQDDDIHVTRGSEGTIINVEILSGRGGLHVRGVRVRLVLAPNSFLPVEGWVENKWDISSIVRSDGK